MAFSVPKSWPFRSLGLYKSSGKHAAPKGKALVPEPRPVVEPEHQHQPEHAATMPRLTGPHTDTDDSSDTGPADADQRAA